jgi:hypothetical protein
MKKSLTQRLYDFVFGEVVGIGTMIVTLIAFFASMHVIFSIALPVLLWITKKFPEPFSIYLAGFGYAGTCGIIMILTLWAAYRTRKWLAGRIK